MILLPSSAWKVSKYGVISGPYFAVFELNTGKCGPEITPYLDTFQAVLVFTLGWHSAENTMLIFVIFIERRSQVVS